MSSLFQMTFWIQLIFIIILQQYEKTKAVSVTFETVDSNPGLIFEQKKNIFLSQDEWKLVYYYDLTQFNQETKKIAAITSTMVKLCNELTERGMPEVTRHVCSLTINQLNIHKEHMETRENIIKSFEIKSKRYRRAPLNFIGSAANYLFGILDEESAEKYNKEINKLKNDVNHQKYLIKEQTTLIEGTLTIHRTVIAEIQQNLISINSFIKDVEAKTNAQLTVLHTITQFNTLATATTLAVMHHEELANKIFNLLSNTIQGKITDIIPFKQMKENLRGITANLNNNLALPVNLDNENPYDIFKFTSILSTLHKEHIIVELTIPIIVNEPWALYRSIPLPIQNKNNCVTINPQHTHFFSDLNHHTYIPANEDSLKKCITGREKILCQLK